MRKTCLETIYQMGMDDPRVIYIGSDLGVGTAEKFKQEISDRFFMEGISEGNIIGVAAGLAMDGKIPFVNTIATFLTRRCFEQIAVDLCLHNLSVRLIGNGGGLVYGPLGPTHEAIEDIAILRALPNMTILVPADAYELHQLLPLTLEHQGPVYIRLAKGGEPQVSSSKTVYEVGQAVPYRTGRDLLLLTTGITIHPAIAAADVLSQQGIQATILHYPTLKPLDTETFLEFSEDIDVILTVEEHSVIGGLGSAIAEVVAERGFSSSKKFFRLGIPDRFPNIYGSQSVLLEHFGITHERIVDVATHLCGHVDPLYSSLR